MRKPFWHLVLSVVVLAFVVGLPSRALAHDTPEHNKEIEKMLFDNESFSSDHKGDEQGEAIEALECATYLCIDHYGTNGRKATAGNRNLETLRAFGVRPIPSLGDIHPDPNAPKNPDDNNNMHRSYTHRGWDFNYVGEDHVKKWNTRKQLMLNTAEKVFDFTFLPTWMVGFDSKCDSFCALVYYTHVLGDYLEDSNYKQFDGHSNGYKIPFAVPSGSLSDSNPDVFSEIEKHLGILFKDQKDSFTYRQLISDINALASKARDLKGSTGGINTDEKYQVAHEQAKELMAVLGGGYDSYQYANRIHMLLKNEEFFVQAFPSA